MDVEISEWLLPMMMTTTMRPTTMQELELYAIMTTKATVEVASSLSDGAILQYWTPGGSSDRSIRRPWKRGTMNQRHDQLQQLPPLQHRQLHRPISSESIASYRLSIPRTYSGMHCVVRWTMATDRVNFVYTHFLRSQKTTKGCGDDEPMFTG